MPIDIAELRKLTVAERLQLVDDIWESIAVDADASPLTAEQLSEARARRAEHLQDAASAVPWEHVLAEGLARAA
jgi:putative addiction module component (TIGR02574 family)